MIIKARQIIKEKEIDSIYAFNIDSAIVMAFSCLNKKDLFTIYDAADLPVMGKHFIDKGLRFFDRMISEKANVIFLGSRYFTSYYKNYKSKTIVIENRVTKNYKKNLYYSDVNARKKQVNKLIISFIGIVRYKDILINLFKATHKLPVLINIYGGGMDKVYLENFCKENNYVHVKFWGWYNNTDLEKIYFESDLIWSVYPAKGLNEELAISNKYFESIYYERPCVFDLRSKVGELAVKKDVGFIVDGYDVESIKRFFEQLLKEKDKLKNMRENCLENIEYFEDYYKLIEDRLF